MGVETWTGKLLGDLCHAGVYSSMFIEVYASRMRRAGDEECLQNFSQ
jgi:hypothetical protein